MENKINNLTQKEIDDYIIELFVYLNKEYHTTKTESLKNTLFQFRLNLIDFLIKEKVIPKKLRKNFENKQFKI